MTILVSDVMREVKNHFPQEKVTGCWTVTEGKLSPMKWEEGCWLALGKCCPQPGVYQVGEDGSIDMKDASWYGEIWLLRPPKDFLKLCEEIAAWAKGQNLGIEKESFGVYSVTRSSGWQQAFARALRPYRRMYEEVQV